MKARKNYLDRLLATEVRRIEYDCRTKTGRVFMGGCVNMRPTIELFANIDPDVTKIITLTVDIDYPAAFVEDTVYYRVSSSEGHTGGCSIAGQYWCAIPPRTAAA